MPTTIKKYKQCYQEQLIRFKLETLGMMRNRPRLHRTIDFCGRGFVDLRIDYRAGRMLIRLRPHGWRVLNMSLRKRRLWVWVMECPVCLSSVESVFLHAHDGLINCTRCDILPSARLRIVKRLAVRELQAQLRRSDYSQTAEMLAAGGRKAIVAREAMELEGLAEAMLVPQRPSRQHQFFGSRLNDPWASIPTKKGYRMVYAGELIFKKE